MFNAPHNIARLILKQFSTVLEPDETVLLDQWRSSSVDNERWYQQLQQPEFIERGLQEFLRAQAKAEQLSVPIVSEGPQAITAHRVHFLRRWWWAAAILILGTTIAIFVISDRKKITPETVLAKNDSADIAPGTNRALLTIGNEKPIDLLNHQSGITVGSAIAYTDGERIADAGNMLLLSTPRGGQYQAVLPDGTKVWLNAASSIKFPSKFAKDKREVEVSGEVYMEVVQNRSVPFSVKAGEALIEVLGTSFNINTYPEEEGQKTTLVSGAVKVLTVSGNGNISQGKVLKPGQQAVVSAEKIKVDKADIEQALAWKNGIFNFNGKSFDSFIKDIERWYNIEVKYEGEKPVTRMAGEMDRGVQLSEIIQLLRNYNLNVRFEGRTLIIKTS